MLIEILRTFWTDMFKKVEINSKNEELEMIENNGIKIKLDERRNTW